MESRIHLGIKNGEYVRLLGKMEKAEMIKVLRPSDVVIENYLFGVWKKAGESQRLIWGGNRLNQMFRSEAWSVTLPPPDLMWQIQLP